MAISAGDSECSTGLSKALYDALLADGRIPWPASMTSEQQQTPKAVAYAIAEKVAEAANADSAPVQATYTTASGQVFAIGVAYVVNFDTQEEDTHNAVATGPGWKFTVPAGKGGRYLVAAAITFAGQHTGGLSVLALRVNSTERRRLACIQSSTTDQASLSGSTVIMLGAGQTVDVTLKHTSANIEALEAIAAANYVTITRLSD